MIELKSFAKRCLKCSEPIIPDRPKYYEGESVICPTCLEVLTVVSTMGLFNLLSGNGMVASGSRLLRYLDIKTTLRVKSGSLEILYFEDEDLANRYSEVYNNTGGNTSWYGERLLRGRSPELDIIRDEAELFAVSL